MNREQLLDQIMMNAHALKKAASWDGKDRRAAPGISSSQHHFIGRILDAHLDEVHISYIRMGIRPVRVQLMHPPKGGQPVEHFSNLFEACLWISEQLDVDQDTES